MCVEVGATHSVHVGSVYVRAFEAQPQNTMSKLIVNEKFSFTIDGTNLPSNFRYVGSSSLSSILYYLSLFPSLLLFSLPFSLLSYPLLFHCSLLFYPLLFSLPSLVSLNSRIRSVAADADCADETPAAAGTTTETSNAYLSIDASSAGIDLLYNVPGAITLIVPTFLLSYNLCSSNLVSYDLSSLITSSLLTSSLLTSSLLTSSLLISSLLIVSRHLQAVCVSPSERVGQYFGHRASQRSHI